MGIAAVIKDVLRSDSRTSSSNGGRSPADTIAGRHATELGRPPNPVFTGRGETANGGSSFELSATDDSPAAGAKTAYGGSKSGDSSSKQSSDGKYKLPAGTGPGTTGVIDTAHNASGKDKFTSGTGVGATADAGKKDGADIQLKSENNSSSSSEMVQRKGHIDPSSKHAMPAGHTTEDHLQLNPVTHEHVRHIETEEIQRVKERDRHIHHIQHHLQPILTVEELEEKQHENTLPVTHIREEHVNEPKDKAALDNQIRHHHDTVRHGAKERNVIDKGTIVNESVHHHVHHVTQPVIAKETVEKHRIHTSVPIYEELHEAPLVHQSKTHAPISIDQYLENGGTLAGGALPENASAKLLQGGQCVHEVDGVAQRLDKQPNLSLNSPRIVTPGKEVDSHLL